MRSSAARRGSTAGSGRCGLAIIASIASLNCSLVLRLAIALTQSGPQALQAAELKLLDRAFAASEVVRDLADAPLLGEAQDDHAALVGGQSVDQPKELGALFQLFDTHACGLVQMRYVAVARLALPAVGDGMGGDLEEPGGERHAAPLEARQVGQCLMEHVGGEVLRRIAVADPP